MAQVVLNVLNAQIIVSNPTVLSLVVAQSVLQQTFIQTVAQS
jgi:ABC-type glucose/galactose transport system permease subunit